MSTPAPASVFAPAKINLFLHIGDKRADGYHDICSLAAFADVGDEVFAEPADALSLTVTGPFATALEGERNNLALRAANALKSWAEANGRQVGGARLSLVKNLPIASGIGGGSSDAAATLKLLSNLWHLDASEAQLAAIGRKLGADVPVCLRARATLMEGIGERLTPWPELAPLPAVLINPGVSLMTADVFRSLGNRTGVAPPPRVGPKSPSEVAALLLPLRNDLEEPASRLAPSIVEILGDLRNAPGKIVVRMSGSGATCFGIFDSGTAAAAAAAAIAALHPKCWVKATTLR